MIVVGADTRVGGSIIEALLSRDGEVRAFVTNQAVVERLKAKQVKVAVGDVSDSGHVGAAATRCFTAVLIEEAAEDDRERSFAGDAPSVQTGWLEAMRGAEVHRIIWVGRSGPASLEWVEYATVDPTGADLTAIGAEVAALDEVAEL